MSTNILSGPIYQPPQNPLDAFDPNTNKLPFATYAPGRRPSWKTHTSRASALSAMNNQRGYRGCVLYALENGRWKEVTRFQPRDFFTDRCDGCQQSLLVDEEQWNHVQRIRVKTGRKIVKGFQVFERSRPRGRLAEPLRTLMLCAGCKQGMGY